MKLAKVLLPEDSPEPDRKYLNLLYSQINTDEDLGHKFNFSDRPCILEPKCLRRQMHAVHQRMTEYRIVWFRGPSLEA